MILNKNYQSILSIPKAKEVAIELNSLSKSHNMAGWRIGWCIGNSEYIKEILKVKSNMDSGMFKPLQLAAAKALDLPASWFRNLNEVYKKRRVLAEEILEFLNCSFNPNQQGLFIWAKLPKGSVSTEKFIDNILHQHKVFLSPGFIFGTNGEGYIRISLCGNETLFLEAINRLKG
jgi:aspartate/methionine/tyrosine aminotransferase